VFCCQGRLDGSTGASLDGRGISLGAALLITTSAIVPLEIVAGLSVWMRAANGRCVGLEKSVPIEHAGNMADPRLPYDPGRG